MDIFFAIVIVFLLKRKAYRYLPLCIACFLEYLCYFLLWFPELSGTLVESICRPFLYCLLAAMLVFGILLYRREEEPKFARFGLPALCGGVAISRIAYRILFGILVAKKLNPIHTYDGYLATKDALQILALVCNVIHFILLFSIGIIVILAVNPRIKETM